MNGYQRNQVEGALWRVFSGDARGRSAPGKVFLTRIKRLLEIDRELQAHPDDPLAGPYSAFFGSPPDGRGQHATFSATDVFCLAIGLDLLDTGFKQREVVFFLEHVRPDLARWFDRIMESPPAPRMQMAAEDRPGCPVIVRNGTRLADCRVYMVFGRVELTEAYPLHSADRPLIFAPRFVRGIEALTGDLQRLNHDTRKTVVMEIAGMAALLTQALDQIPAAPRGRQAG